MSGHIEKEWRAFEGVAVPAGASDEQRTAAKLAFFAGAWAFYGVLMREMTPGLEASEPDLELLRVLRAETRAGVGVLTAALEGARQAQAHGNKH